MRQGVNKSLNAMIYEDEPTIKEYSLDIVKMHQQSKQELPNNIISSLTIINETLKNKIEYNEDNYKNNLPDLKKNIIEMLKKLDKNSITLLDKLLNNNLGNLVDQLIQLINNGKLEQEIDFSYQNGFSSHIDFVLKNKGISNKDYTSLLLYLQRYKLNLLIEKLVSIKDFHTKISKETYGNLLKYSLKNNLDNVANQLISSPRFKAIKKLKDKNKNNFLHLAIKSDKPNIEIIKKIMYQYKINPNKKNNDGQNALHIATEKGNIEVFSELLNYDPTNNDIINAQDNKKETVLMYAIKKFSNFIFNFCLRSKKLNINTVNKKKQSALHTAIICKNKEACSQLLNDKRTNINLKDYHGNTPLHLAFLLQDTVMIDLLVNQNNVKKNIKNNEKLTALDLAKLDILTLDVFI